MRLYARVFFERFCGANIFQHGTTFIDLCTFADAIIQSKMRVEVGEWLGFA